MGCGSEQCLKASQDLSLASQIARNESQSGFLKDGCRTQVDLASHEERMAEYVMRPLGSLMARWGAASRRAAGLSQIRGGQSLEEAGWCARGKWHLLMISKAAGKKRQLLVT